ncbi:MAG: phosphoribosylamine--glycine ligase [Gemmatimonadetes bacterium]|nr:phosphoribosylamine--glycine ligase [Gemmatimonadota bacterium]
MRVLVVGGGGREHALCWLLARSATVWCAPGNAGTAQLGRNIPASPDDHAAILRAVREFNIDLTIVGPEGPLALGLVDTLSRAGHAAFGPTASAARIEASKAWAKEVMTRAGVPTAASRTFTSLEQALPHLTQHREPVVVKASGLAAGKGAVVCESRAAARQAATEMFDGKFGDAGREVVIEEFLEGEELSVLALTDGERIVILPPAQDHKRLLDGDTGPNTGGMGAYSPVSLVTDALLNEVQRTILEPTLRQMARDGAPYRGLLYAGLMISPEGQPSVIEFNCRFGDPETQVILPLLDDTLVQDLWAIGSGEAWRPTHAVRRPKGAAVTTVLASRGYPDAPVKGVPISLPQLLPPDALMFHAGTTLDPGGTLRTSGGRVLCATGLGPDIASARAASQALAEAVDFEGKVFRRDIAWREAARARAS